MKKESFLYIFSNGKAAAISKKDGTIKWEVKLKDYLTGSMRLIYGQIAVEDNKIYIGSSGVLLCLSTKDGSLIWKNELKGWGYQFVNMANANNEAASAAAISSAAAAATIIAAT
jgi:outer membrane protein assembly factor BamB